jgi:glycosyltransferase involved in cell wall biosynthesis
MEYKKISICIPTYNMGGLGSYYLRKSLDIILNQTYKNIELVISDHSVDDEIINLCNEYKQKIDIKYLRNINKIGSSSNNINNAILNASGEIIKILFQDDFFSNNDSLMNQYISLLESSCKWSITSCLHCEDNNVDNLIDSYIPKFNNNILFENTLSSPSTVMLFKDSFLEFDDNLIWYMDTDFYKRMYDKHGEPDICNSFNVVNRRHKLQITRTIVDNNIISFETNYIKNKYSNE